MQLRLWHRMFMAFAALSVAGMAAFALLQIRSFQAGFLHYVNRLERERIEASAQRLAEAHRRHGSWEFLLGDTPRMLRMLELGVPADGEAMYEVPPPARGPGPGPGPGPNQRPRPRPPFGPPPGAHPGPPQALDPPPNGADPQWRPRPRPRPLGSNLRPRLLLLDGADGYVAGNPSLPHDLPAVEILQDGHVVGRLLIAPLPRLRSDIDLQFAREQRLHMAAIAVAVLLAALLLAWALSRWLLHPVRALAAGTRALASGDYATRLSTARRDEFGALAEDFNALAAALERHREARRQWGADIAHELRTPISVLGGEIQALQDGIRPVDAERLASLQAECGRLRDLVEDLYQLSVSEAGGLSYRFEPIDLAALVREAAQAHAGAMRDAGLQLDTGALPARCALAQADRARLRQLLDNLFANAMRYTDAPGRVAVTLEADADACRLRIDDTPPGVPEETLPRLFERLYRVEASRSRRYGGAGLGLAICRNIVEAHGGRIEAARSPLGGLRIEVALPVGRPSA